MYTQDQYSTVSLGVYIFVDVQMAFDPSLDQIEMLQIDPNNQKGFQLISLKVSPQNCSGLDFMVRCQMSALATNASTRL